MGIKNLAYCQVEVGYSGGDTMKPTMDITRWDKLNLVDATRDFRRHLPELHSINEGTAEADEEVDPYSLSVLSQTAYSFIQRPVLEVAPDIILIERQRWRSASSAAIQQWTVRVNTLEAMLWAILETLRTERLTNIHRLEHEVNKRDYEVYGVDPKRVGQYWLGQHAKAAADKQDSLPELENENDAENKQKKTPRSKAEKKAKIALLRSWLSAEPASTAPSTQSPAPTISFTVSHGAMAARDALCLPTTSAQRKRRKTKADNKEVDAKDEGRDGVLEKDIKKLDDITDCFLQVAAWVAWESNRLQLWDVWERKRGEKRLLPPLDEETLREMAELAGEA